MKKKKISKARTAVLLKTSRSPVDRILDPKTRYYAVEFRTGGGAAGSAGCDRVGLTGWQPTSRRETWRTRQSQKAADRSVRPTRPYCPSLGFTAEYSKSVRKFTATYDNPIARMHPCTKFYSRLP